MDYQNATISENLAHVLSLIYKSVDVRIKDINQFCEDEYRSKLNEKFGLDKQFEHEIIESCYWLIEDTEIALSEFTEYGIQGPTRAKNNIGEMYLRLYGILNTIYLQKSVLIQLYEIFKIPNKKKLIYRLKNMEVIKLRNRIASHNVDYRDEDEQRDYFKISRRSIEIESDELHVIGKKEFYKYNLEAIIKEFKTEFNNEMLNICKHLINRFFVKESNDFKELNSTISLVEERINGNMIVKSPIKDEYTIFSSDISRFQDQKSSKNLKYLDSDLH